VSDRRSQPIRVSGGGPPDVVICIIGGSEQRAGEVTERSPAGTSVLTIDVPASPADAGLAEAVAAGRADIVLLDGRCTVPDGWLARLRAATESGDTVATASPLTAARVGLAGPPAILAVTPCHPRAELGGPGCLYVRRSALDLLGSMPLRGASANAVISAVSLAALTAGLLNVIADDLFVAGVTPVEVPAAPEAAPSPTAPDVPLAARLARLDAEDDSTPLRRAVRLARIERRGLSVTIDARSLLGVVAGTQRYTLELALALDRSPGVAVRVVVAPEPAPAAMAAFAQAPGIEVIDYQEAIDGVARTDVVHRPQQVFSDGDLNLMRLLGERLVITHQDLIGYHNPTYHADIEAWERYRRVTRLAFAASDRAVFFSHAALADARAEGLVALQRADVVGIALADPFPEPPRRPEAVAADEPFLVCLGSDYRHKNRPFAVDLLSALCERHNWPGRLVLAGGHVAHGASDMEEKARLDADPDLAARVTDLGPVSEGERAWLLHHARAVLVPSVVEGFGLLPLEAAAAGVPCLFAPVSSLPEVAAPELATLIPWRAPQSADAVAPLLADGAARTAHVSALRTSAERSRWDALVPQLLDTYAQALRAPWRAGAVHAWQELERERVLAELGAAHDDLLTHLGPNQALARDDGFLTAAEQRGLLRVGARPGLARVVLAPFAALGRAGGSRGRSRPPGDRGGS
jgi:glycosyltransferase involved in cell wall biosynthesis